MIEILEKLFLSKSLSEKLKYGLAKSGIKMPFESLFKRSVITIFVLIILCLIIFGAGAVKGQSAAKIPLILLSTWVLSFFFSFLAVAFLSYAVLTYKRFQRTKALESVL